MEKVLSDQKTHRGRLQVQGSDMNNGELSTPWAQDEPKLADEAKSDLTALKSQCTERQRLCRERAFEEASNYIDRCKAAGGISSANCPTSTSFPRKLRGRTDERVDIEVCAGTAFV